MRKTVKHRKLFWAFHIYFRKKMLRERKKVLNFGLTQTEHINENLIKERLVDMNNIIYFKKRNTKDYSQFNKADLLCELLELHKSIRSGTNFTHFEIQDAIALMDTVDTISFTPGLHKLAGKCREYFKERLVSYE